jgi:enoyl-CoA hydratase/carnithine racemase
MSGSDRIELGTKFLDATVSNHVMTVRINRVDRRNAMTQAMYRGVKRAAILADGDPDVDLLVLTGSDDVFCVGGDMSGAPDGEGLDLELDPTDHFPFRHLERCRKTVLSAVNGLCYAGGLNILMFSDLSVVSDRAKFRAPEILRGAPDPWISSRLASYVGVGMAKYWLYTAEVWDANEAQRQGLVGKLIPHDQFEEGVQTTIEAILLGGPKSRAMIKAEMNRELPVPDANMFKHSLLSPEMIEGMKAFLEKRDPKWPRE